MEVKKYNPLVVMNKPKPTGSTSERSSKPRVRPKLRLSLKLEAYL